MLVLCVKQQAQAQACEFFRSLHQHQQKSNCATLRRGGGIFQAASCSAVVQKSEDGDHHGPDRLSLL